MTRKFNFLCTLSLILFVSTMVVAQPNATTTTTSEDGIMQSTEENAGKYPERPKDMWELGISIGHSSVSGDVYPNFPAGFGVGLHVRKALNYMLSYRGGYTFHSTSNTNHYYEAVTNTVGDARTLLESQGASTFVHSSRTTSHDLSGELVINLSNLNFHKSSSKWGLYAAPGFGFLLSSTNADLLDAGGALYNHNITGGDRQTNLPTIQGNLDGNYETNIASNEARTYLSAAVGASYKVNKQINLSLDHKIAFTNAELLDGSARQGTNNFVNDILGFTSVKLNFNLGNPKQQVEPLYWLNPLDAPYDMIANNTQRLDNLGDLLADKDGDGVPDKLDKEQNTPAGAIVNTKGETLDSDGDGVPNYLDKEPYSEPNAAVNGEGVNTKVEPNYVTKDDLTKMEADRDWVNKDQPVQTASSGGAANWFLPMIHFDNGSSNIKPTYFPQLDHVATVLKNNPDVNVVVEGHASSTASVATNNRLSYNRAKSAIDYLVSNYGISASRLTLRYKGEAEPLGGNGANYMNRRVEFRLNSDNESSMGSPE